METVMLRSPEDFALTTEEGRESAEQYVQQQLLGAGIGPVAVDAWMNRPHQATYNDPPTLVMQYDPASVVNFVNRIV